jgi:hypothetical protein
MLTPLFVEAEDTSAWTRVFEAEDGIAPFGVLRDLPKSHKGTMWEGGW